MKKTIILIFYIFFTYQIIPKALEVNVTEGQVEPLPIAVLKFNYQDYPNIEQSLVVSKVLEGASKSLKNNSTWVKI